MVTPIIPKELFPTPVFSDRVGGAENPKGN